jgi:hypothetical protein
MDENQRERRRPGRPAVLSAEERAIPGSIRLTKARWAKLRRLGTAWLNRVIDRAKDLQDSDVHR